MEDGGHRKSDAKVLEIRHDLLQAWGDLVSMGLNKSYFLVHQYKA